MWYETKPARGKKMGQAFRLQGWPLELGHHPQRHHPLGSLSKEKEASLLNLIYLYKKASSRELLRSSPGGIFTSYLDWPCLIKKMRAATLLSLCPTPKALKKIRGNLPSEKSYHGSCYLYWQSLLSSGVRSPDNSIDSVQRKGSCPSITSLIPPGPGQSAWVLLFIHEP